MPYWQDTFSTGFKNGTGHLDITASQSAMIVSILSAGTFFGALTAAPVADAIGRRWGLIASTSIMFNLGVILQTVATSIPIFVAGRFFAGFGVGLISAMSECETYPGQYAGPLTEQYSSSLPIRDCTQVDSRSDRWRISTRYHYWPLVSLNRQ